MLEVRRARKAWVDGVYAFHAGYADVAAACFERALAADAEMADAWLGLHAVGRRQDEAVAEMCRYDHRFGEERNRNNIGIESRFLIGPYVSHRLNTHLDLWSAVAAGHIDRREHSLARLALNRTAKDTEQGKYLRGRLAFVTGDRDEAIAQFRGLIGQDRFFEASSRLMTGIVLAEAGLMGPAKDNLNWMLRQRHVPEAHAESRYFLGLIARAEGDESAAMDHFHHAYALDPRLGGLREAMERHEPEARIRVVHSDGAPTDAPANPAHRQEPAETVEQVIADLVKQVGQDAIKQEVRALIAQTRAQVSRRQAGLPQARMTEHFVFTGPPGTGKTTIARIIARLYKALGILEQGHVVEVDRSGLIGRYHGHTVAQTRKMIDEAMGGVLFIDEAYALQTEGFTDGDPFGQEAIDTLLKRMEDDRDRFVVIAAGYPEPMQRFLSSNPGLRSRFTTTIDFKPYSVRELVQIADLVASETGDVLTAEARAAITEVLAMMDARGVLGSAEFGNARFSRQLVDKAARQRDLRLFSNSHATPDPSALALLTAADIMAAAAVLG